MKIFAKLCTVLCFLSALIIGCTEKETQVEVSSVSLNTATIEMIEGENFTLVATVLPKNAEYDGVTWASSNTSVASVNSGTVTAVKEGTATITASVGGKSATCSVKVSAKIVAVTSITLDKTTLSLAVGESATLTATVKPDDATDKTVVWSSSDESVVKVDNGKVTALTTGQARITAAVGNITASCDVTVYQSDNVIIYTTTDKKVLTPYNEDAFGSAIVSNTYVGDVGIITFEKPVTFIGNMAFNKQSKLKSIVIPNTVSTIGKRAFYQCDRLLSVKLPQSLISIDDNAFYMCSSIKALTFPDTVLEIGKSALYDCGNAFDSGTVRLPKNLHTINARAFQECCLREIIWPEGLKTIEYNAFLGNDFKEITVPGSVTALGSGPFYACELLTKAVFQEGITEVPDYCFYKCVSLTNVTLSSTVKIIDYNAFGGCLVLKNVYVMAMTPPIISGDIFKDVDLRFLSIMVPSASVDTYKEKWSAYKDNIKAYDF